MPYKDYSAKQKKIANVAPPFNKITGADFAMLKKKKKKKKVNNMAKKPVWDKPRPKGLGKSKKLTPAQKAKAKARAKANGRKYPNLVDNMWAASR